MSLQKKGKVEFNKLEAKKYYPYKSDDQEVRDNAGEQIERAKKD